MTRLLGIVAGAPRARAARHRRRVRVAQVTAFLLLGAAHAQDVDRRAPADPHLRPLATGFALVVQGADGCAADSAPARGMDAQPARAGPSEAALIAASRQPAPCAPHEPSAGVPAAGASALP